MGIFAQICLGAGQLGPKSTQTRYFPDNSDQLFNSMDNSDQIFFIQAAANGSSNSLRVESRQLIPRSLELRDNSNQNKNHSNESEIDIKYSTKLNWTTDNISVYKRMIQTNNGVPPSPKQQSQEEQFTVLFTISSFAQRSRYHTKSDQTII